MTDFSVLKNKSIVFIGGGNMAGAILSGLVTADTRHALALTLGVSDHNEDKLTAFAAQGIQTTHPNTAHQLIATADVLVLAVKPQVFADVAPTLAPHVADKLILSVMAGISVDKLAKDLTQPSTPTKTPAIVRSMPNLPASIGMGATGLYATDTVSHADKSICDAIMTSVGITMWVANESDLHTVTAVAGSAPAYFFYLLESMIDKAVQMGLDRSTASQLAIATMIGAGELAKTENVATLRAQVTSAGGTTAAALQVFDQHDVATVIGRAMQACAERSVQLGELL